MIEVHGEDLPELFSSCVLALFSLLVDRRTVREAEVRSAEVTGDTLEEIFFSLLREAFLLFAAHKFLARTAHVTIEGKRVVLTVTGEPLDSTRHTVLREIKAVTAHAMVVERSPGGYLARFVVDV
jgi:SHS2 domain-containing protein